MKKTLLISILSLVGAALVLCFSCSNSPFDNRTAKVQFATTSGSITKALSVSCDYPQVDSLYWSYMAEKTDGGGTTGQTATDLQNVENGALNTGLGDTHVFSVGEWKFTLYAFDTYEHRNAAINESEADKLYIYKGSVTTTLVFQTEKKVISVAVAATTNPGYTDSNEVKGYVQIDPDYYRELRDSSPGSEIKYSLSNDPYDWKDALSEKTAVSASPSVTVYVGFFNAGVLDTTSVRTLTVPVYRGLTTNVGGHATPEGITISFDMNGGSANGADFSPVVAKTGDLYYSVIPDPDTVTPKRAGYEFVGWAFHPLPAEYQEVEYLQSTGGQIINTGVKCGSTNTIEIKGRVSYQNTNRNIFFGSSNGSFSHYCEFNQNYFGIAPSGSYGPNGVKLPNSALTKETPYEGSLKVDGATKTTCSIIVNDTNYTGSTTSYQGDDSSYYNLGGIDSSRWNGAAKYYSAIVLLNGVLKRDFVPCYRKSDKKPGMYDLVTNTFFTNSGSGEFIVGSDVIDSTTTVTATTDHTLYAIWEAEKPSDPKSITVTFDAGEGSCTTKSKVVTTGESYGILPTPTAPNGYEFVGWKRPSDGRIMRALPGYQEVEYLQSSGSQYIEFDFGFYKTDEVEIDFYYIQIDGDKYLVSPASWDTSSRFAMAGSFSGLSNVGYGGKSTDKTILTPYIYPDTSKKYHEVYSNYKFVCGDSLYDVFGISFGSQTAKIRLFYGYNSPTSGKICSYKHTKNGTLVCNVVPCYRKSDSKPGMYDLVTGQFFVNKGTGDDFTVGPDIPTTVTATTDHTLTAVYTQKANTSQVTFDANGGSLVGSKTKMVTKGEPYGTMTTPTAPNGKKFVGWSRFPSNDYHGLVYLQSNGNQYIETNIVPDFNYSAEVVGEFKSGTVVFGTLDHPSDNTSDGYTLFLATGNGFSAWGTANADSTRSSLGVSGELGRKYLIKIDKDGEYVNGVKKVSFNSNSNFESSNKLRLFGIKPGGSYSMGSHRFYQWRCWDGDSKLVGCFVPCYRKSDSKPGMYDLVTKTFFVNQGSGDDFTVGPDKVVNNINENSIVEIDIDHTLYAVYEDTAETVKVTFDGNGGSPGTQSRYVTVGEPYGDLPTPTRDGYTFSGWSDTKGGSSTITKDTIVPVGSDHTLYAVWQQN